MEHKKDLVAITLVLLFSLIILIAISLEIPIFFLIAAIIALLFLFKPKCVILFSIPLFALIISLSSNEAYNYPEIVFVLICLSLGWSIKRLIKYKEGLKNRNILYLILAFTIVAALVGFFKGSFQVSSFTQIMFTNVLSPLFGIRIVIDFFFASILMLIISNEFKKDEINLFMIPLAISALIIIFFSLNHISSFDFLERFSAFQSNPNRYSAILLLFVPIFLSLSLAVKNQLKKTIFISLFIFLLVLISFTISRNSIVIASAICIFLIAKKFKQIIDSKKFKILIISLIIIATVVFVLFQFFPIEKISLRFTNSTNYCIEQLPTCRGTMDEYSLQKTFEDPLFGAGIGSYQTYQKYILDSLKVNNITTEYSYKYYNITTNILYRNTHMHNIILDTSFNTGLIGLILLSLIFFMILKSSWEGRAIPLKEGIFYSIIAILANSMLDMPLYGTEVAAFFYTLAGIALIKE